MLSWRREILKKAPANSARPIKQEKIIVLESSALLAVWLIFLRISSGRRLKAGWVWERVIPSKPAKELKDKDEVLTLGLGCKFKERSWGYF